VKAHVLVAVQFDMLTYAIEAWQWLSKVHLIRQGPSMLAVHFDLIFEEEAFDRVLGLLSQKCIDL